jgi:hypothetical protein
LCDATPQAKINIRFAAVHRPTFAANQNIMIKNTLLFTLFTPFALMAQPTIQQMHLPQAGQVYTQYTDTIGGAVFTPTAASNTAQTWNYVNAFTVHETFSQGFLSPAGLNGSSNFPNATLATQLSQDGLEIVVYYRVVASGLYGEGIYFTFPGLLTQTTTLQNALQLPTPFTLGTNVTVNSLQVGISVYAPGLPLPASMTRTRISEQITGDAYGTLYTPAYPAGVQVVRMKSEELSNVDSTFTDASGTGNGPWVFEETSTSSETFPTYTFYAAGSPTFVMTVNSNGQYVSYFGNQVVPTGVVEASTAKEALAYPNPSTGAVTILSGGENVQMLEISDAAGRICAVYPVNGADRINVMSEGWAAGPYTYRLLDAKGAAVHQARFIIAK